MGDHRPSQPFMNFNPSTTNTTQFWHARKFRDSASVMRGGMCEDSSSGCFAGAFVGRKFKHDATAREFERSLEFLLDDLSSTASSCSDLPAITGSYDYRNVNTGSCTNLSVPRLAIPQPNRPARSCLNLSLSSPHNDTAASHSCASYGGHSARPQPPRDGVIIDISIKDKAPCYTAPKPRPLSDIYGSQNYYKTKATYQPLQRTNSLLDVASADRRRANQRLRQSHSMNFDEDIENMLSELDSAIDELHQYAYELEHGENSTQTRTHRTDHYSNPKSKQNVSQVNPRKSVSSSCNGDVTDTSPYVTNSTYVTAGSTYAKNGDTGFVSDSDTDCSEYSSTMYSTLDSVAPTIVVSSSAGSLSSSMSSSSIEDTLIFDLNIDELKANTSTSKTPENNGGYWKANKLADSPNPEYLGKQKRSYANSDCASQADDTCSGVNCASSVSTLSFDGKIDNWRTNDAFRASSPEAQSDVPHSHDLQTNANAQAHTAQGTNITFQNGAISSNTGGENKCSNIYTNPNIKRPIRNNQVDVNTKMTSRCNDLSKYSCKPKVPERRDSYLSTASSLMDSYSEKTERILEAGFTQSKHKSINQSANMIGQEQTINSTMSSFTDLSVIDSEMGYTADRDTYTETPLAGLPTWKDLDMSCNLNTKSNLDECFVHQQGFRPLNFVGTESRYMIKPIKATELRIPTPIKPRKEISTQTYDVTTKLKSGKDMCSQETQTCLVSCCTQTENTTRDEHFMTSQSYRQSRDGMTSPSDKGSRGSLLQVPPSRHRHASYSSSVTVSPAVVSGTHLSFTPDPPKITCKSPASDLTHFYSQSVPISIKSEMVTDRSKNMDQGSNRRITRPWLSKETTRKPLIIVSDESNGAAAKFYVTMNGLSLHRSNSLPDIRCMKGDGLEKMSYKRNESAQKYSSTLIIAQPNKPISSESAETRGICNRIPPTNIRHSADNRLTFTPQQYQQKHCVGHKQERNERITHDGQSTKSQNVDRSGSDGPANGQQLIDGRILVNNQDTLDINSHKVNTAVNNVSMPANKAHKNNVRAAQNVSNNEARHTKVPHNAKHALNGESSVVSVPHHDLRAAKPAFNGESAIVSAPHRDSRAAKPSFNGESATVSVPHHDSPLTKKVYNKAMNKGCGDGHEGLSYCWKHNRFCGRRQCVFDRKQTLFRLPAYKKLPRIQLKKKNQSETMDTQKRQDRKSTKNVSEKNNAHFPASDINSFDTDLSMSDVSIKSESEQNTLSSISSLQSNECYNSSGSQSRKSTSVLTKGQNSSQEIYHKV